MDDLNVDYSILKDAYKEPSYIFFEDENNWTLVNEKNKIYTKNNDKCFKDALWRRYRDDHMRIVGFVHGDRVAVPSQGTLNNILKWVKVKS